MIQDQTFIFRVSQVFCQGKPTLLGLKTLPNDVPLRANGMYELPLHKSTVIVECAAGHEGLHGILIDADGAAHFVGIARRGEDGDPCKLNELYYL